MMMKEEMRRTRLRVESPKLIGCKKSRGADDQEKKLYILLSHSKGRAHSLYVLDVSSPVAAATIPPPTTTTTITTTMVTTTTDAGSCTQYFLSVDGIEQIDRSNVDSILEFPSGGWPAGMRFASLGRKLYFVGGFTGSSSADRTYHREVFVLDLDTVSSLGELRSYRHKAHQILKPGPVMMSGKIDTTTFVCDGQIFVLSAKEKCPHSGFQVTAQFERLGENQQWEIRATPNFPAGFYPLAHVQVNRRVIISGYVLMVYTLYAYDLDNDSWSEFDTTGWTRVRDLGFHFSDGSMFIRGGIYGVFMSSPYDIPLVVRLEKKQEGGGDSQGLVLTEDDMHDVIKYRLLSPRASCTLTPLGDDKLCYIQAGNPLAEDPRDSNSKETHISLSLFDAHLEPPTHLHSTHYVTYPGRDFIIVDAFFVSSNMNE